MTVEAAGGGQSRFSGRAEPRLQPWRLDDATLAPMPSPISITRCICRAREFAELLPLARKNGWDLPSLMESTGCGAQCGLCRPYLRRMLETGETVFREIIVEESDR